MKRSRPWLPPEIHAGAVVVIARANALLHSKGADSQSPKSLDAIKETFRLVETLFS